MKRGKMYDNFGEATHFVNMKYISQFVIINFKSPIGFNM